jgi:hypothetical protein
MEALPLVWVPRQSLENQLEKYQVGWVKTQKRNTFLIRESVEPNIFKLRFLLVTWEY